MVIHIGLTGGIGSGKSTVAQILVKLGATLIDADAIGRDLMQPGQPVFAEVVRAFGQGVLAKNGSLDRATLASLVFADESKREKLNSIIHPAIRVQAQRQRDKAAEKLGQSGVIVEDIPLLVETGQANRFDGVIVVEADPAERLRRLVELRGMSEADALARMNAQATDQERRALATWVIDNSGSLAETEEQVGRVYGKITGREFS
ncbi:dephospho-CoA kinase [Rothia sp. CCM 9417]|uniref:dephospho-CoA kinase n=1 Tax=Rothia sp. CCM 9417 TaxID=3402657 RepID=UPI003AE44538